LVQKQQNGLLFPHFLSLKFLISGTQKTFMVLSIYIFLQLIYVLRFSAAFNVGGYAIHLEGLLYR